MNKEKIPINRLERKGDSRCFDEIKINLHWQGFPPAIMPGPQGVRHDTDRAG